MLTFKEALKVLRRHNRNTFIEDSRSVANMRRHIISLEREAIRLKKREKV